MVEDNGEAVADASADKGLISDTSDHGGEWWESIHLYFAKKGGSENLSLVGQRPRLK